MHKLLTIALISVFFLAGCELKLTDADIQKNSKHAVSTSGNSQSKELVVSKSEKPIEKKQMAFQSEAVISTTPITFQSTTASISITNLKIRVSKVNYHIWRTADGSNTMKTFSSTYPTNHFAVLLDTRHFASQRGEYQIEAYSVDRNGKEELLAKSAVTFPQYVPILMYHAIDEYKGQGLPELFVSPANFEKQMQYLKDQGYTLLTFERFGDINKVNKPIFVTFDDGMKNNMNALRIFEKLADDKFRPAATEFVIAGRIDSGSYSLSSADIKEMVSSGIFSIQSHTMSHSDLRKVTNYEQELGVSKEKIEQVTGKPVIAIAYPIGYFNDKVVEETKKYYKFAVTTKSGQFIEKGLANELFLIHRIFIRSTTTIPEFAALIR
jgi:hypothetical protein